MNNNELRVENWTLSFCYLYVYVGYVCVCVLHVLF